MSQQIRIFTYLIVLALVLLLAWFGTPHRAYMPRGLLLPSTEMGYTPTSPSDVSVSNDPMLSGTELGTLHVEMYAPEATETNVTGIENYAVQLAANAGANHITLAGIFQNPEDKTINLYGKAIRR